ncbi:centromere-associated protein E-like [Apodemus sylvaticus]|uniref:centromere-associated protein E-like n=1 Tax=Apodemus sylvaticus TaxID=10129 RepID=UPI002242CB88|nr:centromere-associated protein E-like [Apodemus sylvaticus]
MEDVSRGSVYDQNLRGLPIQGRHTGPLVHSSQCIARHTEEFECAADNKALQGTENQEELRILRDELKRQPKIAAQEKDHAKEKREELSMVPERMAEMAEKLNEVLQKLQETQQQLFRTQEAMSKMRVKVTEAESLENEFMSQALALERLETERLSLQLERGRQLWVNTIKLFKFHLLTKELQTKELLSIVDANLKECDEIIKGLRRTISEKEAQAATAQDTAQSDPELQAEHLETEEEFNLEEAYHCLKKQKNKMDTLKMSLSQKEAELSSMREQLQLTTAELERRVQELCEKQEQCNLKGTSEAQGRKDELEQVRALPLAMDIALQNAESDRFCLSKQPEESQEEMKLLIKKREELRNTKEALHIEREQQESIKELGTKVQELKTSELQLLMLKEDVGETQKQLKGQGDGDGEFKPCSQDSSEPLKEESDDLSRIKK